MKPWFDLVERVEVVRIASLSIAALLLVTSSARATECDRDQFLVFAIDGDVIASSGGGGARAFDLDQGEVVLDKATSGCVAMVSTSKRLLFVSALGGAWIPVPYQLQESPAYELLVGDLVGVAISDRRILGYDPNTTQIIAMDMGAQEAVTHWIAGESIAAVVTTRRVIGFSAGLGSFTERALRLKETTDTIESASGVVTVITGDRILTLRSGAGFWAERKRPIR